MPQNMQQSPVPAPVPLKYSRDTKRLYCLGVDLNNPVDSIKDGFYPILENLRSYTAGVLQPRLGMTQIATVITNQTPTHSIRRLNNQLNSTFTRIVGAGTKLATGQSSFSNVQYNAADITFSGKPLAMVPWRPDQSPVSWMYVADSSNMYKLTYNGSAVTTHKIGVAPPTAAPTVEMAQFSWNYVNEFTATTHWSNGGDFAAVARDTARVNTTTTKVLFDSGSSGWCSVVPVSMANIGPGEQVGFVAGGPSTEIDLVYEVYRGSSATQIDHILYDNNPTNTGTCSIVPKSPVDEFKRNCVVLIDSGGSNTYARVTEVVNGPNNTIALRLSTGATTIADTNKSIQVVGSFRTYSVGNIAPGGGDTLDDSAGGGSGVIKAVFTYSTGKGYMQITPVTALDFTKLSGSAAFGPTAGLSDNDYFHLSGKFTDVSQFTQARIMFDCGDGSFTQNYFYRAFTPSDLTAAAKATQTVLTTSSTVVGNKIISGTPFIQGPGGTILLPDIQEVTGDSSVFSGQPGADTPPDTVVSPPRDQTGTGDNQWSEIRFRRGDCIRVGTDWSKSWSSINAIRFEFTAPSGSSFTASLNSLTLWGGNEPDIGDIGFPYLYRYRYHVSSTGARSNWSPATRSGVLSLRNNNAITVTASSAPEVDLIDIQRFGGLVDAWADIAVTTNSIGTYTDNVSDDVASATVIDSDQVNSSYQPWTIAQTPKTGTATTVAGTLVKDNSTNFSTSWLAGTGIKVGGMDTTIRRVLSTSVLEVEDCVSSGSTITWQIPEPFLQSPLPCLWGPSPSGWFFACGDTTNPGRLYFSNQNDPDATGANTQGDSWLDVTGPSEPLQNGFIYNGRIYVFSSEQLYEIREISSGLFVTSVTPVGKGLMYRWAFTVGPRIWFLGKDGVYETDGGVARSITFDQLYTLFPKEGQVGTAVNGFNPPNITTGNLTVSGVTADASTFFRLAYYDGYVYFIYPDTSNSIRCLTYQLGNFTFGFQEGQQNGWWPDVFNPGGTNTGVFCIYGEEGDGVHNLLMGGAEATTSKIYSYGGTTDAGTPVSWHFRQASWDAGERRSDKVWGDFIVDADPASNTINVAAGINNYGSTVTVANGAGATTITGSGRFQSLQTTFDINSGAGVEARNFAVDLSGTGTVQKMYIIEPSYTFRPENSFLRATQYDDAGYEGEKFFQGIEIEADTQNVARTIRVQYDGGQLGDTLTVNHNGRLQKPYSFASAFVAHLARLFPQDTGDLWKLYRWKWIWEPEPPLVTTWESQQTSFGHIGFVHLKAIWVTHTSTTDLSMTITRMDDNTTQTYTIPNSGGVRGKETYLLLGPPEFLKGKTYKFKITSSSPFRLYQRNTGVLVKPWGSAQAYARWVGWGGDAGDGVAQI